MFKTKPTKTPIERFSEPSGPLPATFYNNPNESPLEIELGDGEKSGATDRAIVDAVRMTSKKHKVKHNNRRKSAFAKYCEGLVVQIIIDIIYTIVITAIAFLIVLCI